MTKDVVLNLDPESDFGLSGKIVYHQDGHVDIYASDKDSNFSFAGLKEELLQRKECIDSILKLIKENDPNCPCEPAKEINELKNKNDGKPKRSSKKD